MMSAILLALVIITVGILGYWWAYLPGFVVAVIYIGLSGSATIHIRWLLIITLFITFIGIAGKRITSQKINKKIIGGSWAGILIDDTYKMRLSRFQIILWTILTASTFTVIALDRSILVLEDRIPALGNLVVQTPSSNQENKEDFNALNIIFPEELLIVMGISTTSLAGASLIKSRRTETVGTTRTTQLLDEKINNAMALVAEKSRALQKANEEMNRLEAELDKNDKIVSTDPKYPQAIAEIDRIQNFMKPAAQTAKENAESDLAKAEDELARFEKAKGAREGDIHTNDATDQADWSDMFRGDLVSNFQVVDVAKVQMFFFTIVIIFSYSTLIWGLLGQPSLQTAPFVEFPNFSDSLVTLLGISHAGYLVVKQTGS